MRVSYLKLVPIVLFGFLLALGMEAMAADFACDVMNVQGKAYVTRAQEARHEIKQGDLLKQGDRIEVEKDSYVDIAYDKEWNNLSRIKENSLVAIRSVFPTTLDMARGDVFSRLNKLPKDSAFQIQTPTAVATVRGTIFEANEHDGQMEVRNFSESVESKIFVNVLDIQGNRSSDISVPVAEKLTNITSGVNVAAIAPQKMSPEEIAMGRVLTTDMAKMLTAMGSDGRVSNIQSVKEMEAHAAARLNLPGTSDDKKTGGGGPPNGPGNGPGASGTNNGSSMGGGNYMGVYNPTTGTYTTPDGGSYNPATLTYTAPNGQISYGAPVGGTYTPPAGAYTPPAGGTNYTPPTGGTYNPSTGTYTSPEGGTYNPTTGVYTPPAGGTYTPPPPGGNYTPPSTGTYTPPTGGTYTPPDTSNITQNATNSYDTAQQRMQCILDKINHGSTQLQAEHDCP